MSQYDITHSQAGGILEALSLAPHPGQARDIDVIVRLAGRVSRGEDTEKAATCSALSLATVGELLRRLGATRESALDMIVKAASGSLEVSDESEAWAKAAKLRIANEAPPTPVSGRREGGLNITLIP